MIWGHRHLLGTGVSGWVNARRREVSDRLLGYHRFSAYDLTSARMRAAADAMIRFKPDYVLGYSVALDLFARANEDRASALSALGMRCVVGAAEGFPASDSESRLAALVGAPVAMDNGSVETGLVAHTHPDGGYRVFWRNYFVEAERDHPGTPHRIRVTALYPRAFPLVRYEIGDEIALTDVATDPASPSKAIGLDRFARVFGRCNDYISLSDGSQVHSEALAHAVSGQPGVFGYQLVREPGAAMRLRLVSRAPLPAAAASAIRENLRRINPQFEHIELERVDALQQTAAGKTRTVVDAVHAGAAGPR